MIEVLSEGLKMVVEGSDQSTYLPINMNGDQYNG